MNSDNPNKRFMVRETMYIFTGVMGYTHDDERATLSRNGLLIVKPGACSDGVSPTVSLGKLGVFGPPNGPLDHQTGLPVTFPAVIAHDILLEIREAAGFSARDANQAFGRLIMSSDWVLKRFYRWAVINFGPKD